MWDRLALLGLGGLGLLVGRERVPLDVHHVRLPPLPYATDALEPVVSRLSLELHHDKLHAAYVANVNRLASEIQSGKRDPKTVSLYRYNMGGHLLHSLLWQSMAPPESTRLPGDLASGLSLDFGSVKAFKKQFRAVGEAVQGSGWVALVWLPAQHELRIRTLANQDDAALHGTVPLFICDVWEHAYYLDFETRKGDWLDAWWSVVDWNKVAARWRGTA